MKRTQRRLLVGLAVPLVLATTYRLATGGWRPPLDIRDDFPVECNVHGVPCLDDTVEIVYGLRFVGLYEDPPEPPAPKANLDWSGGCVVAPPTRARVRYCPVCRETLLASR